MASPIADIEGKYEILAKLGEGGMGAIYQVRHRLLDEVRVVKVLRPQHAEDTELRHRFAREARAAIRLRHPNVVQIFDYSVDEEGNGLIVMENIEGIDFEKLVRSRHAPSVGLSLEMARQALRSLGFLHQHGFVHRDVSPDNLMLTLDVDRRPLVKLIDLGIAKRVDAERQLTTRGSFLGKFRYASPEHFGASGHDGIEARSDLYSFGLVLYELLTKQFPMPADTTSQLIAAHLMRPPRPFEETDPEGRVPQAVRQMVLRSLAKAPDERYENAEAWIRAIDEVRAVDAGCGDEVAEEARGWLESAPQEQKHPAGSSTQGRFDHVFGLHTTPNPASVALEPASSAVEVPEPEIPEPEVPEPEVPEPEVPEPEETPSVDPQLAAEIESIDGLIAEGHLTEADRHLFQLAEEFVGAPELDPVRQRLQRAFDGDLRSELQALLDEAAIQADAGDHQAALELVRKAEIIMPETGEARAKWQRRLATLADEITGRERRRGVEEIERHVVRQIQSGRLAGLRAELERARVSFADADDEAKEVLGNLERLVERTVRDRLSAHVADAGVALEGGRLAAAVSHLHEAVELAPGDPWIARQLASAEKKLAAQRAQDEADASQVGRLVDADSSVQDLSIHLPPNLVSTLAEIETLRQEGQNLAAWKRMQQALERFGEIEVLLEARRSLAESILEHGQS